MEKENNILIVEDDKLLAENIKLGLKKEGLRIAGVARNLQSAIEIMKQNDIDLALIDMQLDGPEDGITVATELLKIKWIPIIYMTGKTPLEIKDRLKKTFPAAFLEKPLRVRELYVQINLALSNFHQGNVARSPVTAKSDHLFLPASHGLIRVKTDEILYIQADRVHATLFLSEKEFTRIYPDKKYNPVSVSINMGNILRQLPSNFYLLSRSFVINLDHLSRIDTTRLFIQNYEITIPEGRRKALIEKLKVVKN